MASSTASSPRSAVSPRSALCWDLEARTALEGAESVRIGPALLFERLWQETGIGPVLHRLLEHRKFEFDVERAIFLTVLHRLFSPGQ
ncbi:hypothetical protein LDC_0704 [sediment metagenome]|uniref:Uncharacterized protein n=1 Tax=sediment metagenome TaxID=749907 RepID=D9PGQ7_9ZZZZ